MDKIIELSTKYYIHSLKQLTPVKGGESKTYKLSIDGNGEIKSGYDENEKFFLELPGNYHMEVGTKIGDNEITYINYSYELQTYIITFK